MGNTNLKNRKMVGTEDFMYDFHFDNLYIENLLIYQKGVWAEIQETITKEEAEKQLGKTII